MQTPLGAAPVAIVVVPDKAPVVVLRVKIDTVALISLTA
jgi:hypothetical protein